MKYVFTWITMLALSSALCAQLAPGSTAPNWTHTDLNGNTWDLYTLTAQGKTVFLHMAVTWCPPDYAYHNTHQVRDMYDQYGPNGTIVPGEIMVFMMESDPNTTLADLNGTGTNTMGDWVTGTTFPIIDLGPASNAFNLSYDVSYWPLIYKICPDNKIYEVGQINTQQLISTISNCTFATDAYPSAGFSAMLCSSAFAPSFTLHNNGSTTLTSCDATYAYDGGTPTVYNWTGSLAAGQSVSVTLPSVSFIAGGHTLEVITSNPNGGADDNNTNNLQQFQFNVLTASGAPVPYTNGITSPTFPYPNWTINNEDGVYTWNRFNAVGAMLQLPCYSATAPGTIDEFVIEPIDLSTVPNATLQFELAYREYDPLYRDSLEILVSMDCGVSWTSVWLKSGSNLSTVPGLQSTQFIPAAGDWRAECIDLTAFAGQPKVFIMFRGIDNNGNNMYIDNINVSDSWCATGIADAPATHTITSLFPNPSNSAVNLAFELDSKSEVTVNVYNPLGELVRSENKGELAPGKHQAMIDVEDLASGMYMVELVTGENKTVTRMNVSR